MRVVRYILVAVVLVAAALAYGEPAGAQTLPGVGNPLIVETAPAFPEPGDRVELRVKSFSLDLNRSSVVWRVDGTTIAEGAGATEATFTAEGAHTVRVSATEGGRTFSRALRIEPATVSLVWEANSYTPPLYRGKALPSSEATVRIVALPEFSQPASELIYTWRVGNRVLGNSSGRGKQVLELAGPRLFGSAAISVTVESSEGAEKAQKAAAIRPVAPRILFYESDPLLGMRYERALEDTFELRNEEITLIAHPLFFSGSVRTDESNTFQWTLNGRKVDNPLSDQSSIILRRAGERGGSASVVLTVQNVDEVLQRARNALRIQFEDTTHILQQP